jgi:hypothetical protein
MENDNNNNNSYYNSSFSSSSSSSTSSLDTSAATTPTSYFGNNTLFEVNLYDIDLYNHSSSLQNDNSLYNDNVVVKMYTSDELFMLYSYYSVKSLIQIMNYYDINKHNINNKKKLVKDEMIQLLIIFELDYANMYIVNKRRRLWRNMNELNNDKYFKTFITCKL